MKTYKYTDATNSVVHVIDKDGISRMSMMSSALPEGTEVLPADPLPPAPIADISPRQIRMALTRSGLRAAVEAAVAAGDQDLKDWYEFSTAFERKNSQVTAMGMALGVTESQLDELWLLGASL